MRHKSALTQQLALLAALALALASVLSGCLASQDLDRDGVLDVDDADDDNDGMPDAFEQAHALDPLDAADAALDPDGDGLPNGGEHTAGTDPRDADSDNDTMSDGYESRYALSPTDPADALNDTDGDGLSNRREAALNASPQSGDSDLDGQPDLWEDTHGLSLTDPADAADDADGDGLPNREEYNLATDPRLADSDHDGMPDGWEFQFGLDPSDGADASADSDHDSFDGDLDGAVGLNESFSNLREFTEGADPTDPDSDGDTIPDGYEWACGLDLDSALDAFGDLDGDGVTNRNESAAGSAANRNDTDLDGMADRFEIENHLDPRNATDASADPDGDGLSNLGEARKHSDPHQNDTDFDGVLDGADADPSRNLSLRFTLTFLNVTFKHAPSESGFDPPWELSLVVTVGGVSLPALTLTMEATGTDVGENDSLSLTVVYDIYDGDLAADFSLAMAELDLPETVGVNDDDPVDLDPAGAGETLEFSLSLASWALSGETASGQIDASLDGRNGDSDARFEFTLVGESS